MKRILLFAISALLLCGCAAKKPQLVDIAAPTPAPQAAKPTAGPRIEYVPTLAQDALTAGEGVYTIGWLSDTQHYSEENPNTFFVMTDFLLAERERLNLAYIVHTGDLVQNHNKPAEWEVATAAMSTIDSIPHGVLAGNHDVHYSDANYTYFAEYFGSDCKREYCGGSFGDNRCHFDLIEAGNTEYIFVFLGYPPNEETLRWVKKAFQAYPTRVGVLCTHDYFKTDLSLSNNGQQIYDAVVARCDNLYLVLCGHRYNCGAVSARFDDDKDGAEERTVYQVIANYQAAGSYGGYGYMRFIQVDEAKGELRFLAYSPLLNDYVYSDISWNRREKYPLSPEGEQFTLPIPWAK